ncbi:MAG TPA: sporulation protein YabP [Bacillota bacterium]|nr:sporulation protein YabP [Bacillota bacterium]
MDNKTELVKHRLSMVEREMTDISGVRHVSSFDEQEIILDTTMGVLVLKGEGLHITQLNLEVGNLQVEGYIISLEYPDEKGRGRLKGKNTGLLQRILR